MLTIGSLKLIYFAHFYSVINYGIIFWGSSTNLNKVFPVQKKKQDTSDNV